MRRVLLSSAAKLSFTLLAALSISGCDNGSQETPTSRPNTPPQVQHTVYVNVDENITGVAHTIAAVDLEGDPMTFAITGGPDADKFTIASNGALSFRVSPDYEAPTDSDRNNVYAVIVTISDGKASVEQLVGVTIKNVTAGDFRVRKLATGLSEATAIQPVPGDVDSLFVTERTGRVRLVSRTTGLVAAEPFLDVTGEITSDANRGLTGFAPAPDFAQSHIVYAAMTTTAGELEVRRYKTRIGNNHQVDPLSADTILRGPNTDNELVGGWIGFGLDGMLYIGIGAATGTGEDRADLFGKILRVDVSSDQFPTNPDRDYAIPADNPFAGDTRTPEIWVIGMRHPHGGTFDPATGYLWINDYDGPTFPGDRIFKSEVDMVRPQDKGLSYAPPPSSTLPDNYVYPIIRSGRDLAPPEKYKFILIPGMVYRGPIEKLQGRYIYNRFKFSGYYSFQAYDIWQSSYMSSGSTLAGLEGAPQPSTGFGRDAANNLYIANGAGDLFVVEPS